MALPIVQHPTFNITQPSTQKEIMIRPFLVKEEKMLLMAKESKESGDIYNAVKQIVQNCVLSEGFDATNVPVYDLEYIFIKLRAISVNNIVKFSVEDSDDGITYDLETNLDDVEVIFPENHTNKIMITDDVGVILNSPTPALANVISGLDNVSDIIYETIKFCIDTVFDSEDTYAWDQEPDANKDAFLQSMSIESYNKLGEFFNTSPKIEHVVTYENTMGKTKKVVFRNINDFFILG